MCVHIQACWSMSCCVATLVALSVFAPLERKGACLDFQLHEPGFSTGGCNKMGKLKVVVNFRFKFNELMMVYAFHCSNIC